MNLLNWIGILFFVISIIGWIIFLILTAKKMNDERLNHYAMYKLLKQLYRIDNEVIGDVGIDVIEEYEMNYLL